MGALAIIAEKRLGKATFDKHVFFRTRLAKLEAAAKASPKLVKSEAYMEQISAIDELLFEFAREDDADERKNILRTLDEIVRDEGIELPTETIEQWNERLASEDSGYARLKKADENRIQRFLKKYFLLRAKARLTTQAEVAAKTGLNRTHVASLEAGNHFPQQKTLQKLAAAFDVDVTDLM